MYNQIKAHWKESYMLSANANFRKFLYNLKHGGVKALDFIDKNSDLMSMVCEDVQALAAHIRQDDEAAENKTYFYNLAMRQLPDVKNVLQNKFDTTLVFSHAWHPDFELDGLTPVNFLPEIARREKAEAKAAVKEELVPSMGQEPDSTPETKVAQSAQHPEDEAKPEAPKRKPRVKKS